MPRTTATTLTSAMAGRQTTAGRVPILSDAELARRFGVSVADASAVAASKRAASKPVAGSKSAREAQVMNMTAGLPARAKNDTPQTTTIRFTKWQPGGEYKCRLVVRNVSNVTRTFSYKVPETPLFHLEFPEPRKLNPGMAYEVEVKFRPIRYEEYQDVIEFTAAEGSFFVPVSASLPKTDIQVPDELEFGLCPSHEDSSKTFKVSNTGDVPLQFKWTVRQPFTFSPDRAELKPGASMNIKATFSPKDATYVVGRAVLSVENKEPIEMAISGIGKYPFLMASTRSVDFGQVHVGETVKQTVAVRNASPVPATFKVESRGVFHTPVFAIAPTAGVIPAHSEQLLTVKYAPASTGMYSQDAYDVVTPGGNTLGLEFSGSAVGPLVSASTSVIDFGDVAAGVCVARSFELRNGSATQAANFQFMADPRGIFHLDKSQGSIPARSSLAVTVKFSPFVPINYARQLFCLVQNGPALALDLLGTCHDAKLRPAPFNVSLVDRYREWVDQGLRVEPATMTQKQMQAALAAQDEAGGSDAAAALALGDAATEATGSALELATLASTGVLASNENVLHLIEEGADAAGSARAVGLAPSAGGARPKRRVLTDFFRAATDQAAECSLSEESVTFGATSTRGTADARQITVYNNTNARQTCVWIMPGETDEEVSARAARASGNSAPPTEKTTFEVTPAQADIEPNGSTTFRVAFRPTASDVFYCEDLECMVYYKQQRSFRLVDYDTFVPPWCLSLRATGHTFSGVAYIAKAVLPSRRITFPACTVGEMIYMTIPLRNDGDTPVHFSFSRDASDTFQVRPDHGVVAPESFQLLSLRFAPRHEGTKQATLRCIFNENDIGSSDVVLTGTGFAAALELETDGVPLFLKPTCVGQILQRPYTIRNPHRIPMRFRWEIREPDNTVLYINPSEGVLRGNQTRQVTVAFAPRARKHYQMKCVCWIEALSGGEQVQGPGGKLIVETTPAERQVMSVRQVVHVHGSGSDGAVRIEPRVVNFPPALVGTTQNAALTLSNSSDVGATYRLSAEVLPEHEAAEDDDGFFSEDLSTQRTSIDDGSLVFHPEALYVSGRSHEVVRLYFKPSRNGVFRFRVTCTPVSGLDADSTALAAGKTMDLNASAASNASFLRRIRNAMEAAEPVTATVCARAQFPSLAFTDVLCDKISMTVLWKQLTLTPLNMELRQELKPDELALNDEQGLSPLEFMDRLQKFEFNFGAGALNSAPTVIHARVENQGILPTAFAFRFPNNLQVTAEHWADTGEPDDRGMRLDMIMENDIFKVSPREAVLQPGESTEIEFSFFNTFVGMHELPVVLQLENGKQVTLNFTGQTFWPSEKTIHFNSEYVRFQPIELGDLQPPVQSFDVHNVGEQWAEYECDLAALEAYREENYGHDVFQVENPTGRIAPHSSTQIRWTFRPIEAKEYTITVPVRVPYGNSGRVITLAGRGYHPRKRKENLRKMRNAHASLQWQPKLQFPGQLALLSQQFLIYGDLPQHSVNRQVLILTNLAKSPIHFRWDSSSDLAKEVVDIKPAEGLIEAEDHIVVRCVFRPGQRVEIFDLALECIVHDADQLREYEAKKTAIVRKLTRPAANDDHFHDRSGTGRLRRNVQGATSTLHGLGSHDGGDAADDSGSPLLSELGSSMTMGDLYKKAHFDRKEQRLGRLSAMSGMSTPPPGRASTGLSHFDVNDEIERQVLLLGELPKTTLHVNVKARSHNVDAFRNTADLGAFYLPRAEIDVHEDGSTAVVSSLGDEEAGIFAGVFTQIVRELVEDKDVSMALENVPEEEIPHFCQITTRERRAYTPLDEIVARMERERLGGADDEADDRVARFEPIHDDDAGGDGGDASTQAAGDGTELSIPASGSWPMASGATTARSDGDAAAGDGAAGGDEPHVSNVMSMPSMPEFDEIDFGASDDDDKEEKDAGGEEDDTPSAAATPSARSASSAAASDGADAVAPEPAVPEQNASPTPRTLKALKAKAADAKARAKERRRQQRMKETAAALKDTSLANIVEYVLEGTLFNLIVEATRNEVNIHARPRKVVPNVVAVALDAPANEDESTGVAAEGVIGFGHRTVPHAVKK